MSAVQLTINNLSYSADATQSPIIEHINLAIYESECVCLVGPSGCGKTTLLNTIAGLHESDSAMENSAKVVFAQADFRLGFIFQEPRLMPWLTLQQNIELVLPHKDAALVSKVLNEVGLLPYAQHYPNALSGGMLRRASIARAFVIKPQLLLLDEPFVSLDAPTAIQCRKLLLDMAKAHQTTIIFVTHDINEAFYLADRIVFLSPSPAKIIHELPLKDATAGASKEYESAQQQAHIASLFKQYPKILEGSLASN